MAIDINKLTTQQIRELSPNQIRGLSDSQLRRATQVMANTANKRIANMMKNEQGAQFSTWAEKGRLSSEQGEKVFNLKSAKNRGQVKAEFDRLRNFLNPENKSHSVSGAVKTFKNTASKIGAENASNPEFWKAYREVESHFNGNIPGGYDSYETMRMVAQMLYNGEDLSEIINNFEQQYFDWAEDLYSDEFDEDFDEWDFEDF